MKRIASAILLLGAAALLLLPKAPKEVPSDGCCDICASNLGALWIYGADHGPHCADDWSNGVFTMTINGASWGEGFPDQKPDGLEIQHMVIWDRVLSSNEIFNLQAWIKTNGHLPRLITNQVAK